MIRRDEPRGSDRPKQWLLISQPEHARISYELAAAWDKSFIASHVRDELLAAVGHHDDGWLGWSDSPAVDPETGRPLAFTEMPPAEAQRLWRGSIDACRRIGPLAGWVVASHFSALQSDRDGDFPEWTDWLAEVDAERAEWLQAWRGESDHNTEALADRCLAWLQAFDWMSLWLCCRCPAKRGDQAVDPLEIGGDEIGWPLSRFVPQTPTDGPVQVRVTPWPFSSSELELSAKAKSLPVAAYRGDEIDRLAMPSELAWRLVP